MTRFRLFVVLPGLLAAAVVAGLLLRPAGPEQEFDRGLRSLRAGRLEDADQAASALAARTGYEKHAALLQGGVLLRRKRPADALRKLSLTRPEGDLRRPALRFTGEALYELGRLTEAERVLQQLVASAPDDPEALTWLAYVLHDQGQMGKASALLEAAIQLRPDDPRPRRLLGIILFNVLNYVDATTQFREVLRHSSPGQDRDIRQYLAHSLFRQRLYDEALDACSHAGTDAFLLAVKAECLLATGRIDEAWSVTEQVAEPDRNLRQIVLVRSKLLLERKQPDEAIELLERALRDYPYDMETLTLVAQACGLKGDRERQRGYFDRLNEASRIHQQYSELTRIADREPDNVDVRDRLAAIAEEIGERPAAEFWRRAAADCRQRAERPSL